MTLKNILKFSASLAGGGILNLIAGYVFNDGGQNSDVGQNPDVGQNSVVGRILAVVQNSVVGRILAVVQNSVVGQILAVIQNPSVIQNPDVILSLVKNLVSLIENINPYFQIASLALIAAFDAYSTVKYYADKWEREKFEENFRGLIDKTFQMLLGFGREEFNPNSNHLFIVAIDERRINVIPGLSSLFFSKNRTNFGTFVGRVDLNNHDDMSRIPIQFPHLSQLPNTNVSSPESFQLFLNRERLRFYNLARNLGRNFPRGFLQDAAKTQPIVISLQSDSADIQEESQNLRIERRRRREYLTRVETAVNMIYRRLNENGFVVGLAEENLREISEDSEVNLDEVRILENMVITIRERNGPNYTLENFMNEFHQNNDRERASRIYEKVRSLIH